LSAVSRPLPGTIPRCGGMARSCTDSRAAVPVLSACRGFKNNDSRGTQHRQSRTEPVHSRRLKPMIGLLPRPRRLPTAGSNRRGDMCNLTAAYLNSRTTYPSHLPGNSRIGRDILARRLSATACLCTAPSLPPSTQPLTPHPADTRSISEKARLNRRRPRLWEGCADVGREADDRWAKAGFDAARFYKGRLDLNELGASLGNHKMRPPSRRPVFARPFRLARS
jgi:hypothetical protein